MNTTRVIEDPNPTLPMRLADYVLRAIMVTLLLLSASVALAGTTPSTSSPAPAASTTSAPVRYVECPYCHGVFEAKSTPGKRWAFLDHEYLQIPMTTATYYETCIETFKKHLDEIVNLLRRVSDGRIVDTKPKAKP